jgi:hypothetical protein
LDSWQAAGVPPWAPPGIGVAATMALFTWLAISFDSEGDFIPKCCDGDADNGDKLHREEVSLGSCTGLTLLGNELDLHRGSSTGKSSAFISVPSTIYFNKVLHILDKLHVTYIKF